LSLAAQGAAVGLVGRRLERLHPVAESARIKASRVAIYQADLAVDEDIRELKRRLERDFVSIEVLIHSAGVISIGALESAPVEEFDRQYRVNLRAPYLLTQSLLPMLRTGHRRGATHIRSWFPPSYLQGTAKIVVQSFQT